MANTLLALAAILLAVGHLIADRRIRKLEDRVEDLEAHVGWLLHTHQADLWKTWDNLMKEMGCDEEEEKWGF